MGVNVEKSSIEIQMEVVSMKVVSEAMRLDEIAKQVSEDGKEKKFQYLALRHSIM